MTMSEKSIEEYTIKMREQYASMTGRRANTKLLAEFVEITGWKRKHANKVLLRQKRKSGTKGKRGTKQIILPTLGPSAYTS